MCDAQHIGSIDGDAPERASQDIPPSVVRFVWRRDGGRCRVPGCRSTRALEIHHVVHRADGGSHDPTNLVLTCSACHRAHHRGRLTISGPADRPEVHRPVAPTPVDPTPVGAICNRDRLEPDDGPATVTSAVAPDAVGALSRLTAAIDHVARKRTLTAPPGVANANSHVGDCGPQGYGSRADSRPIVYRSSTAGAPSKLIVATPREECAQALVGLGWKSQIAQAATAAAIDSLGEAVPLERLIAEALRRCPRPRT